MQKTVFVTGATGYLGSQLVKDLINKNYKVFALARTKERAENIKNAKIILGDVLNLNSYVNEIKNCNAIFHLAAITGSNNKELNFKTNIEGMKNIIEAAKKNKIKRIIFVSTISASYPRRNYYAESKLQAEKILYNSDLEITIIRPNLIIGNNSPQLNKIAGMANLPVIPVVGSGNKLIQPIQVQQLSEVLIKTLENNKTINHTITVSGSSQVTFNEFLDKISKTKNGKTKMKLHIPIFAANILATFLEIGLKDKAPINKGQVTLINQDSASSFENLKKIYNVKEIELDQILKEGLK